MHSFSKTPIMCTSSNCSIFIITLDHYNILKFQIFATAKWKLLLQVDPNVFEHLVYECLFEWGTLLPKSIHCFEKHYWFLVVKKTLSWTHIVDAIVEWNRSRNVVYNVDCMVFFPPTKLDESWTFSRWALSFAFRHY